MLPAALLCLGVTIPLPGVEGRIDHLAVDLGRQRLYLAALGNDSVEVVDLAAAKHLRRLTGVAEPQGILYLADQDRIVVASGGAGTCVVYDGATLDRVATVDVGGDADNLRYDAARQRVWVACGNGALAAVDAKTWKEVGRVPLAAHPEAFCLVPDQARAYVNVPGARAVVAVDLEAEKVLASWRLGEAGSNYPLVLVPDTAHGDDAGLLLVGCRDPATLVLRRTPGGEPAGTLTLSGDADDLCHDAERDRIYAVCGAGYVDVLARGPEGFHRVARQETAPGARTGLYVPAQDALYVAVPHRGAQAAAVLRVDLPE